MLCSLSSLFLFCRWFHFCRRCFISVVAVSFLPPLLLLLLLVPLLLPPLLLLLLLLLLLFFFFFFCIVVRSPCVC